MWNLLFLCSPQFNSRFLTSLRPVRSFFNLTTVCCHPLFVHRINMTLCADGQLAWRSDNRKWRTVVVGKIVVNRLLELTHYYIYIYIYIFEIVWELLNIYETHKSKWIFDLMRKAGRISLHNFLHHNIETKIVPIKENPKGTLNIRILTINS